MYIFPLWYCLITQFVTTCTVASDQLGRFDEHKEAAGSLHHCMFCPLDPSPVPRPFLSLKIKNKKIKTRKNRERKGLGTRLVSTVKFCMSWHTVLFSLVPRPTLKGERESVNVGLCTAQESCAPIRLQYSVTLCVT